MPNNETQKKLRMALGVKTICDECDSYVKDECPQTDECIDRCRFEHSLEAFIPL